MVTRRKLQLASKTEVENEVTPGLLEETPHISKKEKRQQKKQARNKKKNQLKEEGQGEPSITEEDKKGISLSCVWVFVFASGVLFWSDLFTCTIYQTFYLLILIYKCVFS